MCSLELMPCLENRSLESELMDDPGLERNAHERAFRSLSRAFFLSRTGDPIWQALKKFSDASPARLLRGLDIGTGGGDLPIFLSEHARREKVPLTVDGADISPLAVEYAQTRARKKGLSLHFFPFDVNRDPLPENYDFVLSSLFLHHLSDEQTVQFFRKLQASQVQLAILSDLIRSRLGWLFSFFWSRFLNSSEVVKKDALLSVKAAYQIPHLLDLTRQAGLCNVTAHRVWPERFLMIWRRP